MLERLIRLRGRLGAMRDIPMLADCTASELRLIARLASQVDIDPGKRLTVAGRGARACCLLLEGKAEVRVGGDLVAVVGPGCLVGELSLITPQPRSATVIARTPIRALMFSGASFNQIIARSAGLRAQIGIGAQPPTTHLFMGSARGARPMGPAYPIATGA